MTPRPSPRPNALWRNILMRIAIFVVFPILAVSVAFIWKNQTDASRAFDAAHSEIADQAQGAINSYISLIQETVVTLENDSVLTVFFMRPYETGKNYLTYEGTVNNRLKYAVEALNGATIRVFMTNDTIPNGFGAYNNARYLENDPLFSDFLSDPQARGQWFFFPLDDQYPTYHPLAHTYDSLLYIRKMAAYAGEPLGYIVALFPIQTLAEKSGVSAQSAYDAKTRSLSLYYMQDRPDFQVSEEKIASGEGGIRNNTQYGVRTLGEVPISIVVYTARHDNVLGYIAIPLIMLLMALFLIAVFTRHIRKIIDSVQKLIDEAGSALRGDLLYRLSPTGDSGVNVIATSVNVLLDRLSELMDKNLKQQDAMREAQLLALQHQINPHFIYNTVELLAGRMEIRGMYDESDALTNFAELFRYNLNVNDTETTLATELVNVGQYLSIQRISRPNIRLVTDIDPELRKLPLPRFTFQPLIENSILHGQAQPGQDLTVTIRAQKTDGTAKIAVEDDGVGMSQERRTQLTALLEGDSTERAQRSIGIFNIHLRLKLLHGSGLTIESREGQGTRVSFEIPFQP